MYIQIVQHTHTHTNKLILMHITSYGHILRLWLVWTVYLGATLSEIDPYCFRHCSQPMLAYMLLTCWRIVCCESNLLHVHWQWANELLISHIREYIPLFPLGDVSPRILRISSIGDGANNNENHANCMFAAHTFHIYWPQETLSNQPIWIFCNLFFTQSLPAKNYFFHLKMEICSTYSWLMAIFSPKRTIQTRYGKFWTYNTVIWKIEIKEEKPLEHQKEIISISVHTSQSLLISFII